MKHSETNKDISTIKEMMEKASKFSSISGISIVISGLIAIIGAALIYFDMGISFQDGEFVSYSQLINDKGNKDELYLKMTLLVMIASVILLVSLFVMFLFSRIKAKKEGVNLFNPTFGRALRSLFVPLFAGGIFSMFLIHHEVLGLVAPVTLIFYGLGLISASKHTYSELEILGYLELVLGIVASYFMGTGLFFWVLGFGVCHVFFGFYIYLTYDK